MVAVLGPFEALPYYIHTYTSTRAVIDATRTVTTSPQKMPCQYTNIDIEEMFARIRLDILSPEM
jgi:hypothetical protein